MVSCREQRPRTERWVAIGIHEAQSLDWGSTALGIARYLRDPYNADGTPNVAGIHYSVGTMDVAQSANPWVMTVPHILRPSGWSVGIEHVGFTHDDIPTPREVILRSASVSGGLIVLWQQAYEEKFQLRHIVGDDIANRASGFFSHYDSTMLAQRMGWGTAGSHTDGEDWPWSDYLDAVADDIRVRLGVEIEDEEVQTRIGFVVPGSAAGGDGLQPYVIVDPNDWQIQAWHGAVVRVAGGGPTGDPGLGYVNVDIPKIAGQEIRAAQVNEQTGEITAFGAAGGIYRFVAGV